MNDKPKRDYLYGIRAWWAARDAVDKESLKMAFVAALVVMVIVSATLYVIQSNITYRLTAPCEDFGGYDIKSMPVRCFDHFGLRLPENE